MTGFKRRAMVRGSGKTWAALAAIAAIAMLTGTSCPGGGVTPLAVTISASPTTAAAGATITLTATATGGSGTYTYAWAADRAIVTITNPTSAAASATIGIAGNYAFTCTVTDTGTGEVVTSSAANVTINPPALAVTATASSTTATGGNAVTLLATVTGGTGSPNFSWLQTNSTLGATIATPAAQSTTVQFATTASGQYTFQVTVTSGGASAQASVTITVTPVTVPIVVEAGTLRPGRAATGQFFSDVPGAPGNNALNGSASQAGVDSSLLSLLWTVDSQPSGSGAVTFSNPAAGATAWTISPPASAGNYVFKLTATNTATSQTNSDTVTVQLLNAPRAKIKKDFSPTRLFLAQGSTGAKMTLSYTSDTAGNIGVYGRANVAAAGVAAVPTELIATVNIAAAATDTDVEVTLPAQGDRQTNPPNTYFLNQLVTDQVGSTDGLGGVAAVYGALADPTRTAANVVGLARGILYSSAPWTLAPTPATATVPKVLNAATEVGDLTGAGTAAGQIAHIGVGSGRAMAQVGNSAMVDFNGDGIMDVATLDTAAQVVIRLGRADIGTAYLAETAAIADAWVAAATTTGQSEIVTGGGMAVTAAIASAVAIAAGDVNGDNNPDLVVLEATAGAGGDGVVIILGQGGTTATPFANQATRSRRYTVNTANGELTGANVNILDVTGDNIADIVVGAPNFTSGVAAAGRLFIIFGTSSLAVDNTTIANVAVAPTGLTINNPSGAGVADQFGQVVTLGNFNNAGANDIVVGCGALAVSGLRVFSGGNPPGAAPIAQYNLENAAHLVGGALLLADVDGTTGPDLIVGAPPFNNGAANDGKVYILSSGTPDGAITQAQRVYTGTASAGAAVGSALAAGDFDGDGVADLLVGANIGGFIDVVKAPITGNVTVSTILQRLAGGANTIGDQILYGDVTGDAKADLVYTNVGGATTGALFGVQ